MLNLKITLKRCKSQLPTFETILPQFLVNIIKPLAYHRPIDITTPHIIWSTFGSYDIKLNQWSTDRLEFPILEFRHNLSLMSFFTWTVFGPIF